MSEFNMTQPQPSWWDTQQNNQFSIQNLTKAKESSPFTGLNSMGQFDPSDYDMGFGSGPMSPIPNTPTPSWWEKWMGSKESGPGYMTSVAPLLQAGLGFGLGMKQMGLAEDQLSAQKNQFSQQFDTQVAQINEDRYSQALNRYNRDPTVHSNPGTYDDYVKNNSIA
jgi:hypothetical protein